MRTPIRAIDEVLFPFPPAAVWRVLADVGNYPRWWPASLGLQLLSPGDPLVGVELAMKPARGRPLRCRVVSAEAPSRMALQYIGSEVEGTGEWRLEPSGGGTRLTYRLDVQASGWLVALLARVMNLGAVHSRQTRDVFANLLRELEGHPAGGGR